MCSLDNAMHAAVCFCMAHAVLQHLATRSQSPLPGAHCLLQVCLPTSSGYGTAFKGVAPLLAALNSSAPGESGRRVGCGAQSAAHAGALAWHVPCTKGGLEGGAPSSGVLLLVKARWCSGLSVYLRLSWHSRNAKWQFGCAAPTCTMQEPAPTS